MTHRYFLAWFGMMVLAVLYGGARNVLYGPHTGEAAARGQYAVRLGGEGACLEVPSGTTVRLGGSRMGDALYIVLAAESFRPEMSTASPHGCCSDPRP